MYIKVPLGHMGCDTLCKCSCVGKAVHVCFGIGRADALRGYCPPCFEVTFVDPKRLETDQLHKAYHHEMTRINGWRIKNERDFEKGNRRFDAVVEQGGPPWPRNRFDREVI